MSFLFRVACFVSPSIFWHLKTESVFSFPLPYLLSLKKRRRRGKRKKNLSVGGSVVNKAVITTNCSIKVGWRPFVRGPSLVSSKVDTSWPMKSPFWLSCHQRKALFLSSKTFFFFKFHFIFRGFTLSIPPSLSIYLCDVALFLVVVLLRMGRVAVSCLDSVGTIVPN